MVITFLSNFRGRYSASTLVARFWPPAASGLSPDETVGLGLQVTHEPAPAQNTFVINVQPIFVKGLNWIPDDPFPGRITPERYAAQVAEAVVLALDAGVDMLLIGDDRLPDGSSAALVALAAIRQALATGTLDAARVEGAIERVRALRARLP